MPSSRLSQIPRGLIAPFVSLDILRDHTGDILGSSFGFASTMSSFPSTTRKSSPTVFEQRSFDVLFKDPRPLAVLLKQGGFQIVFASFHAPQRGTPPGESAEWWADTEKLLFRVAKGDCNACLGSVESETVSNVGAEEQDLPGELLHTLMRKCELWAPATWAGFSLVRHGPLRKGAMGRLHAQTSLCFQCSGEAAKVQLGQLVTAPDIIFANMVLDHIATVASIRVHTSCSTSEARKPRARMMYVRLGTQRIKMRL